MFKNRFTVSIMLALTVMAIFMFVGLPFGQFSWSNVQAQYAPLKTETEACEGTATLQGRWGNTGLALYFDQALTVFAIQIPVRSNLKLLICPNGVYQKSVKVYYAGNAFYASLPPSIVPRGLKDLEQ